MRFLCLHGQGTSSAIFKTQTAIRYELGDDHTYEFVEGTRIAPMASELATISSSEAPHYAYYDLQSPNDFIDALNELENYIAAEGPFDGILAFSQGAGLAAMHIVRTALAGKPPPFKCAVLLCPNEVYDPAAWFDHHQIHPLDPAIHGRPITIPIVVIYGEKDPYRDRSERIINVCDPQKIAIYQHPGGHEVPGLGVKESVSHSVKVIRRGITQAAFDHLV